MLTAIEKNRYLLWQFTRRQIEQRHRGSALGAAWCVLQPLLMMGIYTIVFGLIFKGRYAGAPGASTMDYALGVFLSITVFQILAEAVVSSPTAVLSQPNLVKKVVFPLEVLPLANMGAALWQFCISLVLVLLGTMILGGGLKPASLGFIVALLPIVPLALGVALIMAALGAFIRDIQHVAAPANLVLMYASAVFFSPSMVPPALWSLLRWNPIVHIIDQTRSVLLWHQDLNWESVAYSTVFGFGTLACGVISFRTLKPAFADVL